MLAGVRKEADARAVEQAAREATGGEAPSGSVRAVTLDVTDAGSIAAAAEAVRQAAGDQGLAGLVNNAGVSVCGPVEFVPLDDWRRQFEVNFFGHVAVTQAVLPLLRQRVRVRGRGAARVVMVSSIAGRIAQPVIGPYNASKFALEAMSDALRMEVRPQGIQVSVVEPGAIATPIWAKGEANIDAGPANPASRELYGRATDAVTAAARKAGASAIPVDAVAKVVEACMTRRRPRTRYLVGLDARAGAWAKILLPTRVLDAGMCWAIGIPRK